MMGKVHGVRRSSASSCHALEIRASLIVDRMMIDNIGRSLVHKVRRERKKGETVEGWLENTLPHLRVWLPLAVVDHVAPDKLTADFRRDYLEPHTLLA